MSWQVKNQSITYKGKTVLVEVTIYYFNDQTGKFVGIRRISADSPVNNPNARTKILNDLYNLADDMKAELLEDAETNIDFGDFTAEVQAHISQP